MATLAAILRVHGRMKPTGVRNRQMNMTATFIVPNAHLRVEGPALFASLQLDLHFKELSLTTYDDTHKHW